LANKYQYTVTIAVMRNVVLQYVTEYQDIYCE